MHVLTKLAEKLSSAVVAADPKDPLTILELQGQLKQLTIAAQQPLDLPEAILLELRAAADRATALADGTLSSSSEEVECSLQALAGHVTELRELIERAISPAQSPSFANPARQSNASRTSSKATCAAVINEDLPLVREFITEVRGHIEAAEAEILKLEDNPAHHDAINEVFRAFHTIKGAANCLNLHDIAALAHATESVLDVVRRSRSPVPAAVTELALQATDHMTLLVNSLEQAINVGGPAVRVGELDELLQRLEACGRQQNDMGLASKPANDANTNGSRTAAQLVRTPSVMTTVRLATSRLDRLVDIVGELVIAQAMVSRDASPAARAEPRLARNLAQSRKLTRELQELSMSLRMVPLGSVFRKMARLVRDLAQVCGKEVELVTEGGETELDRNLVEAISDPLMHMVRNALDHGIELPNLRLQAGKPRAGRIELKARHAGGGVVIEVSDDGRGLERERIRASAIKAGVARDDQPLTDQDVLRLVLQPGVSTAEHVTDVSGRGVGMDVVRKNVEALRGRIEINSIAGKGSTFTVRLPLTLAVIDGLVVRVGSERYIVPITSVQQSLRPTSEQVSTVQNRGELCVVRGQPLPLFRLHKLFEIAPATEDPTRSIAVLVEDEERRCCLLVDELIGQHQMVIKPLGNELGAIPGIAGAAILGDGGVGLILDVPGLLDLACSSQVMSHREGENRE